MSPGASTSAFAGARLPSTPKAAAAVAGWGTAVPERSVGNDDLAAVLDTTDEWIATRTGIRARRVASDGETTGPLAVAAARAALDRAGMSPADVGLIVVATCTAEVPMPSTAALVAAALGSGAGAFDLDAACAGFAHALAVGAAHVAVTDRPVLVVGADTMSRVVDPADRATAVLFGDGAGALVLAPPAADRPGRRPAAPGLLAADLATDGGGYGLLGIEAGGSRAPASARTVAAGAHFLHMDGPDLFRRVVREVADSVGRALDAAGLEVDDVSWFVPHQANARIVDAVVARTGLRPGRTIGNGHLYGNTSAASIPLSLSEAAAAGLVADGDVVLLSGFGAGLSVATLAWRWGRS